MAMIAAILSTYNVITAFPLAAAAAAFLLFVLPSGIGVRGKAVFAIALLASASRGVIYEALGGSAQAPEFPEWLIWAWDWACAGIFVMFPLGMVWRMLRWNVLLLAAVSWGIAAAGFVSGTMPPGVEEVELSWPDLPERLDGYRIAQLSDLHCCSSMRGWRTRAVVDRINAAKPDLVCLTGDYVDGMLSRLAADMEPLKELCATDGVWCVSGNHEYYLDHDMWKIWFAKNGFRFLANECVFPRPGLALGGVNDPAVSRYGGIMPNVRKTFTAATNGEFRVLLAHRPKNARENFEMHGVNLQLSGHTHGGIAPGFDRFIACFNGGFVRGAYRMPGGWLFVSPGVGQWSGFPLRFFNPPKIPIIVLRRER